MDANIRYYCAQPEKMLMVHALPATALPFEEGIVRVLPPQIGDLHESLARWAEHSVSPRAMTPGRLWIDHGRELYAQFSGKAEPQPLMQTGLAAEIATWLVLLDRWMETFVVIARARSVWTPDQLAGALTFLTPAFLPPHVVALNPNWAQVAQAVALAVADGPLAGSHNDKHWRSD